VVNARRLGCKMSTNATAEPLSGEWVLEEMKAAPDCVKLLPFVSEL